jgi:hypothetical protein
VETKSGPMYRLLALNGQPLTSDQRQKDDARIGLLLRDPSQQSKLKKQYDDDEQMLETLLRVMPNAFLYDYDGVDGDLMRLKFRPDPDYKPPTYAARVVHSLGGIVLIDPRQKRLAKLAGQVISPVQFGWGLFGHIDEGGTIEIGRTQVGPSQWKTALINVQLSGRMVLFKTIDKNEYETRSSFRAVSGALSLLEASQLLAR